jgi:exopolysaccharide biosynthesis polyprenyl glycosylphosphotransferase
MAVGGGTIAGSPPTDRRIHVEGQEREARPHGQRSRWHRTAGEALVFEQSIGTWRDALLRRMLAVADATTALLAAMSLAVLGEARLDLAFWAVVFIPVWILLAKLHGLYDRDQRTLRHLTVDELPAILTWVLSSVAAMGLFLWITPAGAPTLSAAVGAGLVALLSAVALRALTRLAWRRIVPRERALIVGSGPLADATRRKLDLFPDIHVQVVDQQNESAELGANGALGAIDRIILASHSIDESVIASMLGACKRDGVKLSVVPPARGMFGTAVRLNHVADLPVVEYNTWDVSRSTLLLKRTMDVAVASAALLLLSPVFVLAALAIVAETRGAVIFRQVRAGQAGRPFRMLKFRTMVADAEAQLPQLVPFERLRDPMFKLQDDPRVTRVGRVLRRTSIDELPQLWNVLRGDMSLVGPRPEQLDLVDRYRPEHRFRLDVKPGITGPMQVFGRGRLTFEERLAVEREYIENLSLGRDLRILAMTSTAVLSGKGAF